MIGFLTPPAHKPELPKEEIDKRYKELRWQVFIGIFVGYAGYYLVRKNFTMAMPQLEQAGFEHAALGIAILRSPSSSWAVCPTGAMPGSFFRWV